jgi:ribosomal protein S18 acetylase RimI-like enzyme
VSVPRYEIRVAQASEIDAIGDLYRRSSLSNEGDRENLLANPDVLILESAPITERRTRVAIGDGRIVGFATTNVVAGLLELEGLFVDPEWMRRGVGRELIRAVAAIARSRGIGRIEVTANGHAIEFYEAVGFVRDGSTETRFGPAHRMHLDAARRFDACS